MLHAIIFILRTMKTNLKHLRQTKKNWDETCQYLCAVYHFATQCANICLLYHFTGWSQIFGYAGSLLKRGPC